MMRCTKVYVNNSNFPEFLDLRLHSSGNTSDLICMPCFNPPNTGGDAIHGL